MGQVSKPPPSPQAPELVIITGLSGSGKATVLKCLEDLGYYSVDNLPTDLIAKFADLAKSSSAIRCAALGRKADVDFETEIVLALSELTRCVRMIHAALVDEGLNPGEEVWLPVILEARAAMLRISK